MEHQCPICQRTLRKEANSAHVDYDCFPPKSDHHYSTRETLFGERILIKVRIGSKENRMFFLVNYAQNFSQIWTDPENDNSKIRINHTFVPDLTDLEALRHKLRTYMVFS